MTVIVSGSTDQPPFPVGGIRLWNTNANWRQIEASNGVFTFTNLDTWLAEAKTLNADVLYTLGGAQPPWSITGTCTGTFSNSSPPGCNQVPSDVDTTDTIWKNYVSAVANHSVAAQTHIKYYEIYNEPDLSLAPNNGQSPYVELTTMARDATAIIRAIDPAAVIVGPSPSTANSFGVHFLPQYYAAGGAPFQDVVGIHGYTYVPDTSTPATTPEGIIVTINQLQALMNANGIGSKPIFNTEGYWNASNTGMSDSLKVAYVLRYFVEQWNLAVPRVYWYNYEDSIFANGSLTQTGTALKTLQGWLVGENHAQTPCVTSGTTWTCSAQKNNVPFEILWDTAATPTVPVPSKFTTQHNFDGSSSAIAGHQVTLGPIPVQIQ